MSHKDGYYVLVFKGKEDVDTIFSGGPYYMNRQPVLVYRWSNEFDFVNQVFKKLLVWVRLSSLPVCYWGEEALSKKTNVIGTPLCTDDCTSKASRLTYARVRVEVDVTKLINTLIHVESDDGRLFKQRVIYEWLPYFCVKCYKVGHMCKQEQQRVEKMQWVPKKFGWWVG